MMADAADSDNRVIGRCGRRRARHDAAQTAAQMRCCEYYR
jgi:hypothetical protein